MNEIYQEFYKKYEACKKGEKKAGEKTIKMLFIKAIMQDRIVIEKDKKISVAIDKKWTNQETKAEDGIYDNVCRRGNFPMGDAGDELWIDFCSAFISVHHGCAVSIVTRRGHQVP